ncbi:MAG TPA: DUF2071 domain-containing protein [Pyrinomonadaceae bacterium]|nr:DUF2071 domain-containing protein [Pyrinomonadaceae bacterium]
MKKFLTAKWLDLVMANYRVEPALLEEFLPKGTALDFWNNECYVSLVAFKFFETRVLGFRIPFHTDFLEVNLRFYVKREAEDETRRGVVFIKEIVPRCAIAYVARYAYGEPYETWRMRHEQRENELVYQWLKRGKTNRVKVNFQNETGVPLADSHESFIIEHYWGYTKRRAGRTDEYKVEHPKWSLYETRNAEIAVDFAATYDERFGFLTGENPVSILMAKGSEIAVYKGAKI